jgi:hypothetical protein
MLFASATGSVLVQIQGYGNVRGQLQNAIIQKNDTIAMLMIVNDQIQTSQGSFPVVVTGTWNGVRNGSSIYGLLQNVNGKIRICLFNLCSDAEFVGQGNWTGMLNSSGGGNGNFAGRITFTKSSYPQIPKGQIVPLNGSWTADFMYSIPEFSWFNTLSLTCFIAITSLAVLQKRRRRKGEF